MAYKTVAQVKDSVSGLVTGLNLNNVIGMNTLLERTARELASKISIPESSGQQQITLYDGVTDYVAPTSIFGASLVDFRPQGVSRLPSEYVIRQPISLFDRTKATITNEAHLTFEFVKGVGRVRIASFRPNPRIELDPFTETTGWTAAGSASGLTKDQTVFWQEPASLRFTLTGASTGTLTKTISSQDLTDYVGVGVVFLAVRLPSANAVTDLTSIAVKLGSDASNYYSVSTTTGFLGGWTVGEWLLVALDLANATTTGTPVYTAIDYTQISLVHGATMTNFYIGDMWIALPSPHTMYFQTTALFQASGANPSATITSTADSVLLNDQSLVIYEYLVARNVAQQQGGDLASGLIQGFDDKLDTRGGKLGLIDLYRGNNPSQELRQINNYYFD